MTDFTTSPKQSGWIRSKSSPSSSLITLAPVKNAKSSIVSSLLPPNPGGSIMLTFILPLTLFIKSADFTCCSTSAIISKGLRVFITCSNILCILRILGIGEETNKTYGFSSSHICLSLFVAKCCDIRPLSNCTPSTISVNVSSVSLSSIKTTPSFPTFS